MQNSPFPKWTSSLLERKRESSTCDGWTEKIKPSYLDGQNHDGERTGHIDVQLEVVDHCGVTTLRRTHKHTVLSRESMGFKLAELQRQLK